MLQLRLFGGLRLEGESGSLGGRASQKRRLALLAVLAPAQGPVPREKLIGLLWPNHGDERARHLLSTALYDLRKQLGEEVVMTPPGGVMLNETVMQTDVGAFLSALEEGQLLRAVELYQGPFLDGFFLGEVPEFEGWAETERQRFAWMLQKALEELAEREAARGDHRAAAELWRRLAVADPANTRVALGFMTALAATGDRAAALRFAAVHTALLREEYEAEPAPEVVALAERLREEPEEVSEHPPAAPPAAAPAGAEADPLAISEPRPEQSGVVSTADPSTVQSRGRARRRPRARLRSTSLVAALALGAMLAMGAIAAWLTAGRSPGAIAADDGLIHIAVLPLRNVSEQPGTDYFADGLTEEILIALSRVERFRVTARTSVFGFRDVPEASRDVREVGRQLGVRYVVEGSVRTDGENLRIVVALIDAVTGRQVWSEAYDRRRRNVFELQEQIAHSVATALRPQLGVGEAPLVRTTTRDPDAYDSYLRGRVHWYARTPRDLQLALQHLEEAVRRDSTYALAYAAIADVYNLLGAFDYGVLPPREAYPRARAAAERALALDGELPEAHAAMAMVLFNYVWDRPGADRAYRRAMALRPGFVEAKHWYSLLLAASGRHDEGMEQIVEARELDPRSPIVQTSLARHYYFQRNYARALREYEGAIVLDSLFVLAHLGRGLVQAVAGDARAALESYGTAARLLGEPNPLVMGLTGHALATAGDHAAARQIFDQLVAIRARRHVPAHYIAIVAMGMGDHEEGMRWLERLLEERSGGVQYIGVDPIIDPLRGHPRFARLLEAVAVPGRAPPLD
jgi:TolB-like protein/DNA-binding SARP family transcriptional activator/Tfp pilus assembly protein PilF